ncbi:hypothetical protein ACLOJK_024163, partial [Asimina triloba]
MQQQESKASLEDLMVELIQVTTVDVQSMQQMGQLTATLARISRQPESFPSNTEPNSRQNDIAQCPSVTLRIEVQPEPESQNADEFVSSSSSPNPSSKPTPPSPVK